MYKLLEWMMEAIGWIRIAASPFLLGLLIAASVYFLKPGTKTLVFGVIIAGIGLIAGIVWATKAWKAKGTQYYLSRITASPDVEDENDSVKHEA